MRLEQKWMDDFAVNAFMFIPSGFFLARLLSYTKRGRLAILFFVFLVCTGISLSIEITQVFIPLRYPSFYDIAANVPYDVIFILVNSSLYGGGGFYNHYSEVTVDNTWSKIVSVHEFGHAFAGLADEYTGDVSYSDTYNLNVEPWEPNITTNVDFNSKWKNMVSEGTPLPTPRTEKYKNSVGMFEGGGYVTKGIYSPFEDCRMKSNEAPGFCPVCHNAIRRMILLYCE